MLTATPTAMPPNEQRIANDAQTRPSRLLPRLWLSRVNDYADPCQGAIDTTHLSMVIPRASPVVLEVNSQYRR